MNSITVEIERAKKKFFVQRLQNELATLDQSTSRYKQLQEILTTLTKESNDLESVLSMASDKAYAKKWARLSRYHKIQKISEYLREKITDETERKKVESNVLRLLDDGKMNTSKEVIYDDEQCKITKIMLSKKEFI